jgi:hypothetical protein
MDRMDRMRWSLRFFSRRVYLQRGAQGLFLRTTWLHLICNPCQHLMHVGRGSLDPLVFAISQSPIADPALFCFFNRARARWL